jgi:hypothetical protein
VVERAQERVVEVQVGEVVVVGKAQVGEAQVVVGEAF